MSILFQYDRIFPTRKFRIVNRIALGVTIAYTFWTVCSHIFGCTPIRSYWTHEPGYHCADQKIAWLSHAAANITLDFIIILLPMPVVGKLNLPRKQKIVLMGVFALGLLYVFENLNCFSSISANTLF